MILKRIIVGLLLITGSFLLIIWDTRAMTAEVVIIAILSLNEFYGLAVRKGIRPSKINGFVAGIVLIFSALFFKPSEILIILTLSIISTMLVFIFRKDYHVSSFLDSGVTIMGYLYIGLIFGFIIQLRKFSYPIEHSSIKLSYGAACVVFLVLATSFTDIGGFFVGKFLGKTKLCPQISPGKTVEGAVGGSIIGITVSFIWGYYMKIPILHCIACAILISIFAQLGDLWESVLKRDVSVKDSGDIIIGHGGALDRFDSLFITSPVAYIYFKYIVFYNIFDNYISITQ